MIPDDLPLLPRWDDRECLGENLERFFPKDGEHWKSAKHRLADTATIFCAHCPIRVECRSAGAVAKHGLWGGYAYRKDGSAAVYRYDVLTHGSTAKGTKL